LCLGLKYIPGSTSEPDTIGEAFNRFKRSNRIKFFFRDSPNTEPHPLKQKSTWEPPPASQGIERYLDRVKEQLDNLTPRRFTPNLSRAQQNALRELASDPTLVIRNADKGSGIVVEDRVNYIRDGLAHLSNESTYQRVDTDPTKKLGEAINEFTKALHNKGVIDSIERDYLLFPESRSPRTQQCYFLKKIHKGPRAVRPICSGCGGPTEKISRFVDMQLQPFVPKIKSYIKDSGHLIKILEQTTINEDSIIATLDVSSMYTNIPHEEGIKAVRNRLYTQNPNSENMKLPPGALSDLIKTVLTKNYFQFSDRMYHQIQGTAMGTRMAPSYANLFMADLEERLLANYPTQPKLWLRYLDDILLVWPGDKESLDDFVRYLNSAHDTIKFTCESSEQSVDFLDLTIYKGSRFLNTGKLDIKPFFKHTNKFQYLHYNSAHPRNVFGSLIKGELTRLLRACSDENHFDLIKQKMLKLFKDRGYPHKLILDTMDSVPFTKRQELINDREMETNPYDTFLVLPYTPDMNVRQLHAIIRPTEEEGGVPKPCLSLKRTKNLANRIVRAKLKETTDPPQSTETIRIYMAPHLDGRSAMCGTPGCKCCKAMSKKVSIHSAWNHRTYRTAKHSNCNSCNVIYLLECKKCTLRHQYVGQTKRPLSARVAGHRAKARSNTTLPLYKHFAGADHDFERDARFSVLEKTTTDRLLARESHWIETLDTVYPHGLNSRYDLRTTEC